jgi:hypothetical protein
VSSKYTEYRVFLYLVLTLLRYRTATGLLPNTVCTFFINIFSIFVTQGTRFRKRLCLMRDFIRRIECDCSFDFNSVLFFGKPHDGLIKFLLS